MSTPNPIQQHTQQQVLHVFTAPAPQQQTKATVQQPVKAKPLKWKKTPAVQGRNVGDLQSRIKALIKEIRSDLSSLRLMNRAIVMAKHIEIQYTDKSEEYKKVLSELNKLSREQPSEAIETELQIIVARLDLDMANLDAIFPQIIYSSAYMRNLMEVTVNQIGYPELKEKAEVAFSSLESIEPHLKSNDNDLTNDDGTTSVEAAMRTIMLLDEMKKFQNKILQLRDQDLARKRATRNYVLLGMSMTILAFSIIIFALYWNEISWNDIRNFPIMGIPLGIGIWSFIGSFAAMLQQFYQKSTYEFGDTLKWIIIRPVLGVLMGAVIYLAFSNGFGIDINTGNGGLSYMVAFFVGLSDSFAIGIIERIQGAITSSVKSPDATDAAAAVPAYVMTSPPPPANTVPATQPTAVPTNTPAVTPTPETTNSYVANNPATTTPNTTNQPNTITTPPTHDLSGEDEDGDVTTNPG